MTNLRLRPENYRRGQRVRCILAGGTSLRRGKIYIVDKRWSEWVWIKERPRTQFHKDRFKPIYRVKARVLKYG